MKELKNLVHEYRKAKLELKTQKKELFNFLENLEKEKIEKWAKKLISEYNPKLSQ